MSILYEHYILYNIMFMSRKIVKNRTKIFIRNNIK